MLGIGLQQSFLTSVLASASLLEIAAYRQMGANGLQNGAANDSSTYVPDESPSLATVIGEGRWEQSHSVASWRGEDAVEGWWQETYALVDALDARRKSADHDPEGLQELRERLAFISPHLEESRGEWQFHLIVLASLMIQVLSHEPITEEFSAQALQALGAAKLFLSGTYEDRLRATLVMQRVLPALPESARGRETLEVARSILAMLNNEDTDENRALLRAYGTLIPRLQDIPIRYRKMAIRLGENALGRIVSKSPSERVRALAKEALRRL